MLFAEEDAPQLKTWIVKRLENTSDADADVLADYVLALLRHDGDIETVRRLCEEEIPDFLKEDSAIFVKDLFDAVLYRSFIPGAPPPPRISGPVSTPRNAPSAPSYNNFDMIGIPVAPNGSRKRSFNDQGDGDAQTGQIDTSATGRVVKQPRLGNLAPGGHYDNFGNFMPSQPTKRFPAPQGYHQLPSVPPGMPSPDANDPMATMMAMQAMGFPMPGMSGYDQNGAPTTMSRGPTGRSRQNQMRGQRCRDYDTKGFCARGNNCKFEHGQDSIYVPQGVVDEYDPTNSSLLIGAEGAPITTQPPLGNFQQFPGSERGRGRGRGRGQFGDRGVNVGSHSRRGGRAEFSSDRPNFDRSKTTIVVENIPEEKFSKEAVQSFFSEFGNIVDVTMQTYKRLALVKYDDWNAAQAAYNSPKVIFDNRFVKVYWYKDEASLPQPPGGDAGKGTVATSSIPGNTNAGVPERATSVTRLDIEEFARKQAEVQKAHEEKMKKKAEMEAAVAAMQKRQEDLLKRQAEEKRKLMEKLAAKEGKTPSSAEANGTEGKPLSQAEALKKQLAVLEAEARSLGIDPAQSEDSSSSTWGGRGRGRGRGWAGMRGAYPSRGYRGRGGGGFVSGGNAYKLDNRPKKVGISGIDLTQPEKDESLRQYLLGVGEYAEIETTPKSTSITFKDRFTAEKFMYGIVNSEIPGVGKVELAWIQTPLPPVILPSATSATKSDMTAKSDNENRDADMDGTGEDNAMMQDENRGPAQGQKREPQELDYDISEDNEWAE